MQLKQVSFKSEFKMCRLSTVMISMGISSTSIAFSKGTKPIDQSLPFSVLAHHDRCTCLNQMPSHCDPRILYCWQGQPDTLSLAWRGPPAPTTYNTCTFSPAVYTLKLLICNVITSCKKKFTKPKISAVHIICHQLTYVGTLQKAKLICWVCPWEFGICFI